jgi:ATP-dependent Lon protease
VGRLNRHIRKEGNNMKLYGEYFYGNKASDYAIENGYLDYATLAKAFDAVLNNDIMQKTYDIGYWDQTSGIIDNSEEIEEIEEQIETKEEIIERLEERIEAGENVTYCEEQIEIIKEQIEELEEEKEELENDQYNQEIYQYYIVSDNGANILEECNEIVFYNEELDMYVWGVTHYGTSWAYVLTDIKLNCKEEAYK